MLSSPRCRAKTRLAKPCMSPALRGKKRCRMHGGAAGSGAQPDNKNALKHGRYTSEAFAERQHLRNLLQQARALIKTINGANKP
ncbi:MAG TPA: HGGxSTG domain-containing protein [Xanthobacteraceae bacterium]